MHHKEVPAIVSETGEDPPNRVDVGSRYYRYYFEYNRRLVARIFESIDRTTFNRVIEFGSGSGFFTIPLLDRLHDHVREYIIVDPFKGPYRKDRETLVRRLRGNQYLKKVTISDMPVWDIDNHYQGIDLVIGHDVFCDLSIKQLRRALVSGLNSLDKEGMFIHSGLSPNATTRSERLFIKLDGYASSPLIKDNWFSPGSEFLYVLAGESGFGSVDVKEIKIPLKFKGEKAFSILKDWRIKKEGMRRYERQINEIGIEFPKEQIMICRP